MKTSELEVGKFYTRKIWPKHYYHILGFGIDGRLVYEVLLTETKQPSGSCGYLHEYHDWDEYDPTEVCTFFNVYNDSSTGPHYGDLSQARRMGNGEGWLGTMEVVTKGEKRIKTIWHGNV